MSYRTAQIYISYKTLARLRRSVELYPRGSTNRAGIELEVPEGKETPDERADRLLNEAIDREYPDVVLLEKQMKALEANFMKARKVKNEK